MSVRLENVRSKLVGQLVHTPLVGDVALPGIASDPSLRLKLECVQVGGGVWARGALAEIGSRMGAVKGFVAHGAARAVFCAVRAAQAFRVPIVAVPVYGPDVDDLRSAFAAVGCEVCAASTVSEARETADRVRSTHGFEVLPGPESEIYAAGLASLGLELAEELPLDVESIHVAPAVLAGPIEAGLRASGRSGAVVGVEPDDDLTALRRFRERVRVGLRVDSDLEALAALAVAVKRDEPRAAGESVCVVLSS